MNQCDPGDCTARCTHCGPSDPCGTEDCVYDPDYRQQVHAGWPRVTPAQAIARIQRASAAVDEHWQRYQNGFITRAAYDAAVETAIAEIQRLLREAGQ